MTLRTRVVRCPPVVAARRSTAMAAAPILRRRLARGTHADRFSRVRRVVPGSLGQIPQEITAFGELAGSRRPVRICEIGTLFGGTSLFLCGLAPSVRVFAGIDLRIRNAPLVQALAPARVETTFLEGSTRDRAVREELGRALGGEPIDLLFIDGDHTYVGVRADLDEYSGMVRPGGLIAFHDIVPDLIGSPVPTGANWSGGVPTLWNELRSDFRHWEFVSHPDQDGFGIGVIEYQPGAGR